MLTGSMIRLLKGADLNALRQVEAKGVQVNYAAVERELASYYRCREGYMPIFSPLVDSKRPRHVQRR